MRRRRSTHHRYPWRCISAPVIQRVPPQLPLGGERVRWRTGDEPILEQLRVGLVVGTVGSDVDRNVADQTYAAHRRVLTQRRPFALEPHLVGDHLRAAEATGSSDRAGGCPTRAGEPLQPVIQYAFR